MISFDGDGKALMNYICLILASDFGFGFGVKGLK